MKAFSRKIIIVGGLMYSIITTLLIAFFIYLFDLQDSYSIYYFLPIVFVIFTLVNMGIIYKFSNYIRSFMLKKLIKAIPEIDFEDDQNLNLVKLKKKISEIQKKRKTEIDTMKEMEVYRKEYIGNISHELKTPLFSIQGYVETLLDDELENEEINLKYLERIGKSVDRLIAIVEDLDMINRYEANEIDLQPSKFDFQELSSEIIELLEYEADKKTAKISFETKSKTNMVWADKQKIAQVMINLLSNAIYYANRENASIIIKTHIANQKLMVDVIDNGMGIKKELVPRIFERFYRVETSRNRRKGGSGLGLAIVRHILEAHHEEITVESEYLEGTKFTFSLPSV